MNAKLEAMHAIKTNLEGDTRHEYKVGGDTRHKYKVGGDTRHENKL